MAKTKKSSGKIYLTPTRMVVFIILSAIVLAGCLIFQNQLEQLINGRELQSNENLIEHDGLVVHYLDVGQADCIAIEFPTGEKMLIDAGTKDSASQMIEYIDSKIFADSSQEKVFDYVLLTHSDADHCGGMTEIFANYQVNNVYRPQIYIDDADKSKDANCGSKTCNTKVYTNTINAMNSEPNCNMFFIVKNLMNTTQKICSSDINNYYEFEFYSPLSSNYNDENDFSPIFSLTYNSKVFMFTGDASQDCEKEALQSDLPKVDVLKVGHHGSKTSSGEDFISTIRPTYAVIQVGADNTYGHPNTETLNTLEYYNSTVYRTDINKNIIANVTKDGELCFYANVSSDKISVFYFVGGAEVVLIYFCFFVKYNSSEQKRK